MGGSDGGRYGESLCVCVREGGGRLIERKGRGGKRVSETEREMGG